MSADGTGRRLPTVGVALVLVALAALWLVRPWLHGVVLLLYVHPSLLLCLAALVVGVPVGVRLAAPNRGVGEVLTRLQRNDVAVLVDADGRLLPGMTLVTLAVVLALVLPTLGTAYSQAHTAHTLDFDDTNSLPEIDAQQPRVLPRSVARQYAANSLQYPRYELAAGDVSVRNGHPTWSFGLAPDGALNQLLLVGRGATFVDMTTQQKRVEIVEADPQVGFGYGVASGSGIISKYRWRLLKGKFLVQYEDPVMVEHDDSLYMAVPYVAYDHHVRLTPVPTVYATPRWGGVALVTEDGTITYLSPEEARQSPVLADQRLVPFGLARYQVSSMRYSNGIVNKWFVHEDQLELAPVPGEGNDQPFMVRAADGSLQYFVAAEPYGDAQGIYQIWTIDGRTGEVARYQLPSNSALVGPRKAADYVRKANDRTDWDRFSPSEPLPAVVDGSLYWQVRVVSSDATGVAYTAFVDADTGDVYTFSTDEKIRAFLAGDVTDEQTTREPTAGGGVVIRIRDANGTVVNTVTVAPDQTVEIASRGNGTANTTTSTAA